MENPRKKIYGREQLNVDARTSGIRAASHTTGAKGDTYSTSVVHSTANNSSNIWAALVPALGATLDMARTIYNKKETEAERQRRKAEAEEEARLKELQALDADRWVVDVQNRIRKEIEDGTITSTDQLSEWFSRETDGLDYAKDAAFIHQSRVKLAPVIETAHKVIADKARKQMDAGLYNSPVTPLRRPWRITISRTLTARPMWTRSTAAWSTPLYRPERP